MILELDINDWIYMAWVTVIWTQRVKILLLAEAQLNVKVQFYLSWQVQFGVYTVP